MSLSKNNTAPRSFEEKSEIESNLLALANGEAGAFKENYRAAVRDYENYLVPFLIDDRSGAPQIFKIDGLYGIESVPVFLSEEVYLLFRDEYLKKHGLFGEIASNRKTPALRALSGKELFEIIPRNSLGGVFILSGEAAEPLFNFNLAEVFMDCFYEIWTDPDLKIDSAESGSDRKTETEKALSDRTPAIHDEIEKSGKFRKLFENKEWIVLISQSTKNKLLKGEFSRDDFEMDRHGDGRIFIFSDAAALNEYQRATEQPPEKLYNIKVDRRKVFGSDLTGAAGIIIDPHSQTAAQIGKQHFRKVNDLFAAFEIEEKLSETAARRKASANYAEAADYYISVKEFPRFILPVDKRSIDARSASIDLPCNLIQKASGRKLFPVFTAEDCFEAFRRRCLQTSNTGETNLVEPYFIGGTELCRMLISTNAGNIVFNPEGPVRSIVFEANFALKVYCA